MQMCLNPVDLLNGNYILHSHTSLANPPHLYMQSAPFEKFDCMMGHSYISLIILACCKLVLAIIGSVLAVQNRCDNIPELREAKVVGVTTHVFLFAVTVILWQPSLQ